MAISHIELSREISTSRPAQGGPRRILVEANVAMVCDLSREVAAELLIGVEHGEIISCPFVATADLPDTHSARIVRSGGAYESNWFAITACCALSTIGDLLYQAAEWARDVELLKVMPEASFEAVEINGNEITFVIGS